MVVGERPRETDPGVQTVNSYDAAGRPLEITRPSGRKQLLTYSFLGDVTQIQFKNSGGTVTEMCVASPWRLAGGRMCVASPWRLAGG